MSQPEKQMLSRRFRVGDVDVEIDRNLLRSDDWERRLEPKVMDVLRMLAARQGDVVSRAELIETIWQVEFGADESLTRAISHLRKALGDSRDAPCFIETISKRGYRLVAPVSEAGKAEPTGGASSPELSSNVEPASVLKNAHRRTLVALSVFAILAAFLITLTTWRFGDGENGTAVAGVDAASQADIDSRRRIAVLPFTSLSTGEDDRYFADGLTEELLVTLGRAPGLSVTARASSFKFRDAGSPHDEIAQALDVDHLVTGTVRRADDDLRITIQLIRASDGEQLWSQSYDRTMDDVFAIQQDIAENIAAAFEIVLDDAARQRMRAAGLRDVEAFIAYQKGLELYLRAHSPGGRLFVDLRAADEHFKQVIEHSPGFANAWALRVDFQYHLLTGAFRSDDPQTRAEGEQALERMRGQLLKAYQNSTDEGMRAQLDAERTFFSDDWTGLGVKLDRFLAKSECFGQSWAFEMAPVVGRSDSAMAAALRFMACDPLYVGSWYYGVKAALWTGDIDQTEELLDQYDAKFPENFGALRQNRITLRLMEGRVEDARALSEEFGPEVKAINSMMIWAYDGQREKASQMFDDIEERYYADYDERSMIGHAIIGDREGANAVAASLDRLPAGPVFLLVMTEMCRCGAPFDLEATPNLAARLKEAQFSWPPKTLVDYPLKDW